AAGNEDGRVQLWETATGKERYTFGHTAHPWGLAFHPGGKVLATGDSAGPVRLWNVERGGVEHTLPMPQQKLDTVLAFSPDGKLLACGSRTFVRVWKLTEDGRPADKELWVAQAPSVGLLAFSPDGRTLYSAPHEPSPTEAGSQTLRRWDAV